MGSWLVLLGFALINSTAWVDAATDQQFVVVTSEQASPGETFAALEAALLLGNITNGGKPLQIFNVSDVPNSSRVLLAVGYHASVLLGVPALSLTFELLGRDGFRISIPSANNTLPQGCVSVSGAAAAPRGATYGVYELLETAGLEFLAWDETTYPVGSPNLPPAQLASSFTKAVGVHRPSFEYRDLSEWPVYSNRLLARRLRLNNNEWLECVEDTAQALPGGLCYGAQKWDSFQFADPPGMAHTIYSLLCSNATNKNPNGHCDDPLKPPQDLIKTHPEWFWPHGDPNTYGQVCYHNASLVAFLIQQVRSILAAQPGVPWLSITQNDNMNDCMDPEELAILKEEGGYRAGNQLRAINAIADAVKDEFPTVLIDTFAYEQTSSVPAVTLPRDNVIIRVATTWCNSAGSINDTSLVNIGTQQRITSWGTVAKHLSVWDYTANYDNPTLPYPDYFKWGDNFRFEKQWKVEGYYGEGNAYNLPGRDMVELTIYLQSQLLWSTKRNATALLHHFLSTYYGAAAPHVLAYMTTMIESMHAVGMCRATGGDGGEGYPPSAAFLTPRAVISGLQSFAAARTAVANNPTQLGRVDRAKLGIYYVVLLRWSEMRKYSQQNGQAWAVEPTVDAVFEEYSRIANDTTVQMRCFFIDSYKDCSHDPLCMEKGRCLPEAFGHGKGITTADGSIPFLSWLEMQLDGRNGSSSAWCQPGYNSEPDAPCWQNCSQVFECANNCDSVAYCRGGTPPPLPVANRRRWHVAQSTRGPGDDALTHDTSARPTKGA